MKLLSVIVPVYNTKNYLDRCVNSIRKQSYANMEILLVDDGSTDQSGALCEKFALEDKRIRVFHKENGGSSSARNLGVSHAKGDFLTFIDSDDYIETDMYSYLMEAAKRRQVRVVQIGRIEEDEEGKILPDVCLIPQKEVLYQPVEFLEELLMYRGDSSFCTKIFQKDLFLQEQFPEGELNEDLRLMVSLLEQGVEILSIPHAGYHVVYRQGSNTRKEGKESFSRAYMDSVHNADRILQLVREKYTDLLKQAERFGAYQRLLFLLHIPISQMERTNTEYKEVVQYIRKNRRKISKNPYLNKKDKNYLKLLSVAPRFIRFVHAKYRGL